MRPTRVIYVENDPALLGILSRLLRRRDDVEVLLATASAEEALSDQALEVADVALLDLALGAHQMNGVDLGLAMRKRNPDIGIVLHSQHPLDTIERRLPVDELMGWSTVPKTGEMRVDELCSVLKSTARGMSHRQAASVATSPSVLDEMSGRLRTIMGMAALGLSTKEIARRMDSTEAAIRQDLSKAYRLLVPGATDADDLRTRAVLEYLRLQEPESGAL